MSRRAKRGALAAGIALSLVACGGGSSRTTTATTASTSTTVAPTTTAPAPTSTTTNAHAGLVWIWPFTDANDVAAWQDGMRTGGHQPWKADPGQVALSFTQSILGYKDVTKVVTDARHGDDARETVGYATGEGSGVGRAAVVHLIKVGSGDPAGWEVVGTDDTDLSLTTPSYGSTVHSPVTVGGTISGVDESLRIIAVSPAAGAAAPLGTACCLPAGGTATPWHTSVTYPASTRGIVVLSVSTGGHLQAVERFAITAVRAG